MTLAEMRQARAAKIKEATELNAKAKAEERALSDEENTKIDALLAEADGFDGQIKAAAEADQRQARLGAAQHSLAAPPGRKTTPDALDALKGAEVKDNREDDLTCGFPTYDEFCHVIRSKDTPGSRFAGDERLDFMTAAYGQNEATGEDGGFLIPPVYSNRMLERTQERLGIIEQCDKLTLTGNSITVNGTVDHDRSGTTYRHGGVVVYWVGEAGQITRSSLKFRPVELRLNKLACLSFATDEILADGLANFGTRLLAKHADAMGDELLEAVMFGNGTGKPLGAFAGDACEPVDRGTASTILYADIINMEQALWASSDAAGRFYFNPECWSKIRQLKLASGTGNDPAVIVDTRDKSIDGRPYKRTDHCSALGTAGDIVLGDFSQYLLAMKGTVQTAMSIHLRFDYGETAYRSTFRVDGKPAWERVLTPRKGTQTVSPFVKLN